MMKTNILKMNFGLCVLVSSMLSCTPSTYTYFPAQRRIKKAFDMNDSIYVIFPYSSFSVIGSGDRILTQDFNRADLTAAISNASLQEMISKSFKSADLKTELYMRDSLGQQFLKMIQVLYDHKNHNLKLYAGSHKKGLGLIYGVDSRLRDFGYWIDLSGYHKGGAHATRWLVFTYLCLFDLQTGTILDYKYQFHQRIGGWNSLNKCTDESGFQFETKQEVTQIARHLIRRSSKK